MLWILLLSVAIICVGLFVFLLRVPLMAPSRLPYVRRRGVFSSPEQALFDALELAVGNSCLILGKVRVGDIITIRAGIGRAAWRRALRQLNRKTFDFVLCSRDDFSVICGVELDGRFHSGGMRGDRFSQGRVPGFGAAISPDPRKTGIRRGGDPDTAPHGHPVPFRGGARRGRLGGTGNRSRGVIGQALCVDIRQHDGPSTCKGRKGPDPGNGVRPLLGTSGIRAPFGIRDAFKGPLCPFLRKATQDFFGFMPLAFGCHEPKESDCQ